MPTLYHTVDAPGVNILKTVSEQVIAGLLDELDLLRLFKDAVYPVSSFEANSNYDDGSGSISLNKNRCDVEISYIMDKSQVLWPNDSPYTTPAYGIRSDQKGTHTPVLLDTDSDILIEYYTKACGLDMNFKMNFQTFDDATNAFDKIQNKYKGSLVQTPFDIAFSFPVSRSVLQYLFFVWRSKTAYKNGPFSDYIKDKKVSDISWDVRRAKLMDEDADKALMIRCKQLGCVGQMTMDQKEPEAQMTDQLPDSFTISFNFNFQFGRPDLLAIHTPISIDNQVVPSSFFQNIENTYHWNPEATGAYQDLTIDQTMRRSFGQFNYSSQIIRIPEYDDWYCTDRRYMWYEYRPLVIAHFTLDGPVTTIDLKQLSDVQLHPVVQDIIRETKSAIFSFGGLFHIGVFANKVPMSKSLLTIDDDCIMTVRSDRMDAQYRLVISETTNLHRTSQDWDELLVKYRYFFPMTIERNLKSLVDKKLFYITPDDSFMAFVAKIMRNGSIRPILLDMIDLGEDTRQLLWYTQNAAQLVDYMENTPSARKDYTLPSPNADTQVVLDYYNTKASVEGRSLLVAFVEQCLSNKLITLAEAPSQYLRPNPLIYPYVPANGGYYGYNTPLRVLNYTLAVERSTK